MGLLFVAYGLYGMLSSTLSLESDLHGYVLAVAIFGGGVGGLLAFASIYSF